MNGPTKVVIPEQRYYSCSGCSFFEHFMVRSGRNPIYEKICMYLNTHGKQPKDGDDMGYRLYNDETPLCCPFLEQVKRDDKINEINGRSN